MEELSVSKKIKKLPPEARKQVQDFIDFISLKYSLDEPVSDAKNSKIAESSFFGIWKNRSEMSDSTNWVKDVRKTQWTKK
jgi:mRNA-degrading endonuclease RelE of RelBE toxin-antitoxin system